MSVMMSLLGACLVFLYFQVREPLAPLSDSAKTDNLTGLRKKYFISYTIILAVQLTVILVTNTFALALADLYGTNNWIGLGFAASLIPLLHELGIRKLMRIRGNDWFNGLRAFLNLSYGFEYLRVLDLVIQAVALLALALLGYGMLER